ncbi:MAG: hypothetical protein H6Q33_2098 [Deltaproteobacteria bacterium]|jgi:hypothetical protein|nr:hypothetical protein [Deltaproteobacteria bacterium]
MDTRSAAASVMDGTAWEQFCDTLKHAGKLILADRSPTSPLDRAEGFRYLSRLARLALEKFVEHNDPTTPRFYRLSHETAKIGCDNPDSFYQNAAISGQYEYRLWGNRGTVSYLGFGTYYGNYGSKARAGRSGYLDAGDLRIAPDGSFEIILSCRQHPGNWLPLEPDSSMLIIRQNVLDRAHERLAELHLDRIGAAAPPAPLTPQHLGQGLADAARFVVGTAELFIEWAESVRPYPNEIRPLDHRMVGSLGGDPNICYYLGYWRLEPDEALVIEATPPRCEYWNFQLNNYWLESLDYRYHHIHYNKHTTTYRPDGSFQLVVAHTDPGVPNWVETAGHRSGTMGLRWIKADSDPAPRSRVVKLSELKRR